jgi:peroxiredoxin Q/BCP
MLNVGDKIPDFNLQNDDGVSVSAASLLGQRYVLYFYPKDDTPGCTTEACNFRDNLPKFGKLGVPVFGVSPQDAKSHGKFRNKFSLNFPLLVDTDHKLADSLGLWVKKKFMGREYMGVQRSTLLVGPDGVIQKVWEQVKPEGHAEEVLTAL